MKKEKIAKVAELSGGLIISRKKEKEGKKYLAMTLGALNEEKIIEKEKLKEFKTTSKISKYQINKGDIILKLTVPFTAKYINDELDYILSNNYCKIKVDKTKIHPEYLEWYLNSYKFKKFLEGISHGVIIRRLPLKKLKELKIEIPSLEEQLNLIKFKKIVDEKEKLYEQLIKNRRQQFKYYVTELYKGEK